MIPLWTRFSLAAGALTLLAACGAPPPPPPPVTKTVRILQQKVEIAEALKRMARVYEAEHPGVRLVIETIGGGQDFDAALADRFQAGELPDVFMSLGDLSFDPWVPYAEDLTEEPWVSDLRPGTGDAVTRNGRLLGNPLAIEGYGILYNTQLFRQAGIVAPPTNLPQLAEACRRLEALGVRPFANGWAEWWVLGVHNFNVLLGNVASLEAFAGRLERGGAPGEDAAVVEGWMDLLDLMARYGDPKATVNGSYAASVAEFLAGKAAMLQQGNWIEPDVVKAAPGFSIGVLPLPVGTASETRFPMGVPNFWVVNRDSPVKDEAKAWLTWLWKSDSGHRILRDDLMVIPVYRSLGAGTVSSLSAPFAEAWDQGRVLPWAFPRYQDRTKAVAAAMRSYLENPETHEAFWAALGRAWRRL